MTISSELTVLNPNQIFSILKRISITKVLKALITANHQVRERNIPISNNNNYQRSNNTLSFKKNIQPTNKKKKKISISSKISKNNKKILMKTPKKFATLKVRPSAAFKITRKSFLLKMEKKASKNNFFLPVMNPFLVLTTKNQRKRESSSQQKTIIFSFG